jgi:hypothetical protein
VHISPAQSGSKNAENSRHECNHDNLSAFHISLRSGSMVLKNRISFLISIKFRPTGSFNSLLSKGAPRDAERAETWPV